MLEDEDAYKVDNEAANRHHHKSVMFDLRRLKCSLQGKREIAVSSQQRNSPFSNDGVQPTSMASAKMKKAMNRRNRAFTNPAMTSALTNLQGGSNTTEIGAEQDYKLTSRPLHSPKGETFVSPPTRHHSCHQPCQECSAVEEHVKGVGNEPEAGGRGSCKTSR